MRKILFTLSATALLTLTSGAFAQQAGVFDTSMADPNTGVFGLGPMYRGRSSADQSFIMDSQQKPNSLEQHPSGDASQDD